MLSTRTHKQQFFSKLKTIKKSNNRLISREHLFDQHQQSFSCDDDDVDAVVTKWIKKRIKRTKFTLEFKCLTKTNS